MSMWVPANDIEQHMREALRAGRQEEYFRLLARAELLLPFAEDPAPSPNGTGSWATWATEDRTHVLVFTSPEAMRACLHSHAGAFRTVRFTALAEGWPDSEWWLAVDPGTPIEGYLPAWFVRQVAVGDTNLPEESSPRQAQPHSYAAGNPSGPPPGGVSSGPPRDPFGQFESSPFQAQTPRYGDAAPPPPAGAQGSSGLPRRAPAAGDEPQMPPAAAPRQPDTATGGLPRRDSAPQSEAFPQSTDPYGAPMSESFGSSLPSREPAQPPMDSAGFGSSLPSREPAQPPMESAGFGSSLPSREPAQPPMESADGDRPLPLREPSQSPMESAGFGYQDGPAQSWEPAPSQPDGYGSWGSAGEASTSDSASLPVPMSTTLPDWPTEDNIEEGLAQAASTGDTQSYLNVLLQAWAYLPVAEDCPPSARPGDPEFRWHTDLIDGAYTITAFTSLNRLRGRYGDRPHINTTFGRLTAQWPGLEYSLYVNPSTEVGANIPGPQVTTLVTWARTQGLLQPSLDMDALGTPASPAVIPAAEPAPAVAPEVMQKVLPHQQVGMTLERGYDRVAGFVHRYDEVADLNSPEKLYNALGLLRDGVDFAPTDDSVHVVRWVGHRTDLYRVAYGGNDPTSADRNGGWIVEPPPFSGDGYAPSVEGRRIIEFKVDSVRLPHGATMTRIGADGHSMEVAVYDSDRREWIRSGVEAAASAWDISPAGDFRQEQQHA